MTSSQTKEIRFEDQIFFPAQVDGDQLVYKNPDFQLVRRRYLNLNLNGLLVICQIDNTSPWGAPGGKLVPGSHKRCKLGHTVIRHFSRGDQRIREVIPVPHRVVNVKTKRIKKK